MSVKNPRVEEYIDTVCSYVKYKQARSEIKIELLDHLEQEMEELEASGMEEDKVAEEAFKQMGDAELIGKQLNESHKTCPEWSILIFTLAFCIFGVITNLIMINNGTSPYVSSFYRSILEYAAGFCIMIGLYFFDYRKISKYAKYIYIGAVILLILLVRFGMMVNGSIAYLRLGNTGIDITQVSLFLFAISLSEILKNLSRKNVKGAIIGLILLLVPIALYMRIDTLMPYIVYFIMFITLMVLTKEKISYVISTVAAAIGFTAYYFAAIPSFQVARLMATYGGDPNGAGYQNYQVAKALSSTGILGHGINVSLKTVPTIQTDLVLTYIIYAFGWLAGIIVIAAAFTFIARMLSASKKIKNNFGKLIVQSFMCIFGLEFLWNILMVLGIVPITAVGMPFISSGGHALIQMTAVGIIMSIYRGKSLSNINDAVLKA